jgi:hypothetical protein
MCRVDLGPDCGDHAWVTEPPPPTPGFESYGSWDVVIAAQAKAIEVLLCLPMLSPSRRVPLGVVSDRLLLVGRAAWCRQTVSSCGR